MNTAFRLMAQHGSKAIIPIDAVCRDYFFHLTPAKLVRKISKGEIALPLVRIEDLRSLGLRAGAQEAMGSEAFSAMLMTVSVFEETTRRDVRDGSRHRHDRPVC